jgi:cyclopropane-fatty-acyl-phospholipid synthase
MAKGTAPQEHDLHDASPGAAGLPFKSAAWWLDGFTYRAAMLLGRLLVKSGRLTVGYRDEPATVMGDGSGDLYAVQIKSAKFLRRLLTSPDLAVGEGYVDGEWDVREGDLAKAIGLLLVNDEALRETLPVKAASAIAQCLASPHKKNDPRHSRTNVAHHYDIGNDLYSAFLDEGMNYSCAFFECPEQSLRDAQLNKLRTAIGRLGIEPGMFALDIGCGWGELTRLMAEETNAERVVGITLAEEQCKLARARVAPGHGNRLSYLLEDYRLHATSNPSTYDRIVSIGMFEHVGRHHFVDYFRAIRNLLKPGGRALVHSIVRPRPGYTSPWIDKYIFPGGYIPSLGEMTKSAVAAGLRLSVEPFIHESFHYANTLRHWRRRFNEAYPSLDQSHYDERFRRMWNFYLAGSESAFDANGFCVAQVLVEKAAA